jgi:hypothetical protein
MKTLANFLAELPPTAKGGCLALGTLLLSLIVAHLQSTEPRVSLEREAAIQALGSILAILVGLASYSISLRRRLNPDYLTKTERRLLSRIAPHYQGLTFEDAKRLVECPNSFLRLDEKGYIKYSRDTDMVFLCAKGRDFIAMNGIKK